MQNDDADRQARRAGRLAKAAKDFPNSTGPRTQRPQTLEAMAATVADIAAQIRLLSEPGLSDEMIKDYPWWPEQSADSAMQSIDDAVAISRVPSVRAAISIPHYNIIGRLNITLAALRRKLGYIENSLAVQLGRVKGIEPNPAHWRGMYEKLNHEFGAELMDLSNTIDGAALHFAGDPPVNVGQDADAKGGEKSAPDQTTTTNGGSLQQRINAALTTYFDRLDIKQSVHKATAAQWTGEGLASEKKLIGPTALIDHLRQLADLQDIAAKIQHVHITRASAKIPALASALKAFGRLAEQ
jgi:hypothetical protein